MSRIAIAAAQTPWECRWTIPNFPPAPGSDLRPDTVWVCVRTGERKPVTEATCEHCPHWEADDNRIN